MSVENIPISSLVETESVQDTDWIAVDDGTNTKKVSVLNFNATGAGSAAASASAAAMSAASAAGSAADALTYKTAVENALNDASTIVSNAQTYANAAESSKNDASSSASAASTSASQAATSANQAASYATGVQAYATEAKSYAEGGTGTRVDEETDNAKYYSQAAHTSETNAATSETNAASSESNAATSESNASASASSASANALKAEGYAVGSQNGTPAVSGEDYYHDNAKYYKEEAATSATNASTSETNAGLSETAAAASQTAAKGSEEDSEAWAWGKIDGVDVPATHPAYHNNAKFWADNASGAAGGGVTSFNGRNGNVISEDGDYVASQIPYDNTYSELFSDDTQEAIDEVNDKVNTLDSSLSTVAKSGLYGDLDELPTLGTAAAKDFTGSVTSGSTDLVTSGGVDSAINTYVNLLGAKAYQTDDTTETDIVGSDIIPFYDASASAKRKLTLQNLADKVLSNPNLVDNPFFTVNSRGKSSYTTGGQYTVDRWAISTNYIASVAINADGTLTIVSDVIPTSAAGEFRQFLRNEDMQKLDGKTLTLSAIVNGELFKGTAQYQYDVNSTVINIEIEQGVNLQLRNIPTNTKRNFVRIIVGTTASAKTVSNIKAVKLELGEVSTLAMDTSPDYHTELAKCRTSTADSSDTYANQGQIVTSKANDLMGAKNLLPNDAYTKTINDVTFTVNADGSISCSGTSTAEMWVRVSSNIPLDTTKEYTLSGCPSGGDESNTYSLYASDEATLWKFDEGSGVNFTPTGANNTIVDIHIENGINMTGKVFKPMIRLASIQDDTYVPYAKTNRELTLGTSGLSNENLLDNPWFTVNQRGITTDTQTEGTARYTLDRWKARGIPTVKVNSDGSITFDNTTGTEAHTILNLIEPSVYNRLKGRTVTISVDAVCTGTGSFCGVYQAQQSPNYQRAFYFSTTRKIYSKTLTLGSNIATGNLEYNLDVVAGESLTVYACKLELGTVSTLAKDIAPNYQQELAKCQRYYYRCKLPTADTNIAPCFAKANNKALGVFELPVPMRATPTFAMSDYTKFTLMYTSGLALTALPVITDDEQHRHISFDITRASLTAGRYYMLQNTAADAYMEFDAEL